MDDLTINSNYAIAGHELWFTTSRASGPGGQHVNKTETAVTLHWYPAHSGSFPPHIKARLVRRLSKRMVGEGEVRVFAQDERSQVRNKSLARERLVELVLEALKPRKRRIKTKPSRSAKRRRLEGKRRRGELKRTRQSPTPRSTD